MVLPAPVGPTRPTVSPGFDVDVDVLENGLLRVAEGHVVELDVALDGFEFDRVLSVLDVDGQVHDAEDALGRGAGVLVAVDDGAHLGEGLDQALGEQEEDHEGPLREIAGEWPRRSLQDPDPADDKRRDERDGG